MDTLERVEHAIKRYLEFKDYEYLGMQDEFLVYDDEGCIVFVCYDYSIHSTGFIQHDESLIESFEKAMIKWYQDYPIDCSHPVRLDRISLVVVGDDRAVMKHYVNILGFD